MALKQVMTVAGCALWLSGCMSATMTSEVVRRKADGTEVQGAQTKGTSCTQRRNMVIYAPFPVRMTREVPCKNK